MIEVLDCQLVHNVHDMKDTSRYFSLSLIQDSTLHWGNKRNLWKYEVAYQYSRVCTSGRIWEGYAGWASWQPTSHWHLTPAPHLQVQMSLDCFVAYLKSQLHKFDLSEISNLYESTRYGLHMGSGEDGTRIRRNCFSQLSLNYFPSKYSWRWSARCGPYATQRVQAD